MNKVAVDVTLGRIRKQALPGSFRIENGAVA